jgi:acyl transferase domain-containing protein/acyl carrier protein
MNMKAYSEKDIEVESILVTMLAELLSIEEKDIDENTDLREFGLDSVSLNEFTEMINSRLGIDIDATLLFEYSTMKMISGYLKEKYVKLVQKDVKPSEESHTPATIIRQNIIEEQSNPVRELAGLFTQSNVAEEKEAGGEVTPLEDIAIIGMSGRLPQSDNLNEFWEHLMNGEDMITEIPIDRFPWQEYYGDARNGNKSNNKSGGFLKDIKCFDAGFFNISPREAELMDPQQRILLEEVWRLFEEAGYRASEVAGSNTGVFIGAGNDDYNQLITGSKASIDSYAATGTYFSIIANRISYLLNLHGPSTTVDTACSSSLVAIHQAVQAIRNGECDMAVAGGVNIICVPRPYLSFSHAGMLSPDGKCKSFDNAANGYVRAEGVGAILLKPLLKAIEDGNHIYGVIKGTAVNHCGLTNSLTAPSPAAQAEAIIAALERGKVSPDTITYIEAHGTGTSLGDPIEINGIKKAFEEAAKIKGISLKEHYCGIGSVKSNIGHMEIASGIAGVFKILLAMNHKLIPGNLHFHTINERIHLEGSPFYIVDDNMPWQALTDDKGNVLPRRAGVSSFGFGGTNAHIILEEYQESPQTVKKQDLREFIIVLSAKTEERLKVYAQKLLDYLYEAKTEHLADIAYTLQTGREAMLDRLAIITESASDLKEKLKLFLQGKENKAIFHANGKQIKKTIALFEGDEEFSETLRSWIEKGKLEKILNLWVKGVSVDWKLLYSKDRPGIVSLPTYPFMKEPYWISKEEKEQGIELNTTVLHPLLHENKSDFIEQKFITVLRGTEFFLKAHVIGNQRILPGVAYLEMALAAIKASTSNYREGTVFQLSNILWTKPVIVKENPVLVKTALYLENDEQISFEVRGEDESMHSEGTANILRGKEENFLDITAKKSACNNKVLTGEACYRAFEEIGFNYGKEHRGIDNLYIGDKQLLAGLTMPEEVRSTSCQYTLHPSILDSAIQATMGLMMIDNKMEAYLPLALEKLTVINGNFDIEWAYINALSIHTEKKNINKFDIALCDKTGKVCIKMEGLTLKKLGTNQFTKDKKTELLLFTPEWREAYLSDEAACHYDSHLLIACEMPDMDFEKVTEGYQDTMSLKEIKLKRNEGSSNSNSIEDIGRRYKAYAGQVFEEIKKTLTDKNSKKSLVQIILPKGDNEKLYTGLSGMLKTAEQENPKITGQIIEVEPDEITSDTFQKIFKDKNQPTDKEICYQSGKRYVKGWRKLSHMTLDKKPWRDNGIYLITGGGGELGLLFALEIAKEADKPTIIITGRGSLSEEKREKIRNITSTGARIEYRQTDVTDIRQVQALIKEMVQQFGTIHGILYCAGINRDNYIYKKSVEELQSVLEPKVNGLIHIDKETQDISLDFFILFSSIAGSLGNIGQADYAAANAFMDEYAAYRNKLVKKSSRYGKTLSINWPLWEKGGMHMEEEAKRQHEKQTGMKALPTENGIEAFYKIYQLEQEQVMVAMGDEKKIYEFVNP